MKRILYFVCITLVMGVMAMACTGECDHPEMKGKDAYILSSSVVSGVGAYEGIIRGDSVFVLVPQNVNMELLKIRLQVSEQASVLPKPESVTNWEESVRFTVTSADGTVSREYVVAVRRVTKEKVFNAAVRLGSQKEVDGFGANGYTRVQEIVLYAGSTSDPIRDLSSLSALREVSGGLTIQSISARDIYFENLQHLGQFEMFSLAATKVRMPNLKMVAGRFRIGNNDQGMQPFEHPDLEMLCLPRLKSVGGSFVLFLCSKIETLEHLSNLEHIGKDLIIQGGRFTSLKGLERLRQLNGGGTISGALSSLEGFRLETVGKDLILSLNQVENLEPLKELKKVGGLLCLQHNDRLENLKGIEHIDVQGLEIRDLKRLKSLEGLPVKPVLKALSVQQLPELTDISALSGVTEVEQLIYLVKLDKLTSLNGLENLKKAGIAAFAYMSGLTDLSALKNLETVGRLQFKDLKTLEQLPVFTALTELENLELVNLVALKSLEGLECLTKITKGGIMLQRCSELTNLSGLQNITEVNFYQQSDKIYIDRNQKLASYQAIIGLLQKYVDAPGSRLYIANNYYNPTVADVKAGTYEGVGGSGISGK